MGEVKNKHHCTIPTYKSMKQNSPFVLNEHLDFQINQIFDTIIHNVKTEELNQNNPNQTCKPTTTSTINSVQITRVKQ